MEDLRSQRIDYSGSLLPLDLDGFDPWAQFEQWMADAFVEQQAGRLAEPAAMVVSTTRSIDGVQQPTSRVCLLKEAGPEGFVFYTNYDSAKGDELASNPVVCLLFWWPSLMRQIRIEGSVERVSRAESQDYFAVRPRGSQIGAWASQQSRPLASRDELVAADAAAEARFADAAEVPCPPNWGGYRVRPTAIEFWSGQPSRLHDRVLATRDGDAWQATRLNP